jgi:hypothetical protein
MDHLAGLRGIPGKVKISKYGVKMDERGLVAEIFDQGLVDVRAVDEA